MENLQYLMLHLCIILIVQNFCIIHTKKNMNNYLINDLTFNVIIPNYIYKI